MIDFSAVSYLDNLNHQLLVKNIRNDSVISHTKTPQGTPLSCQLLAQYLWFWKCCQTQSQEIFDAYLKRVIQFYELLLCGVRKFDPPKEMFSHPLNRTFFSPRPGNRFFLRLTGFFVLWRKRLNNLPDLQGILPGLAVSRSLSSGASVEPPLPIFFQESLAILWRLSWWKLLFCHLRKFCSYYKLYNKNDNLFLVIFLFLTSAQAKDLGVYGETFPIAEENLLNVIQSKLEAMEESGELVNVQKGLAEKARTKIRHPLPVKGLMKTHMPRQWVYDPSLTLEKDVKDHQGHLVAAKGTVINPLDTVSWGAPLLLFDGDDPEQVAWAKEQDSLAKWVLVKGSPVDMEEKLKRPVYFDQAGMLATKFGIQQVPCRIRQKGKTLWVEELRIEKGKPRS